MTEAEQAKVIEKFTAELREFNKVGVALVTELKRFNDAAAMKDWQEQKESNHGR